MWWQWTTNRPVGLNVTAIHEVVHFKCRQR